MEPALLTLHPLHPLGQPEAGRGGRLEFCPAGCSPSKHHKRGIPALQDPHSSRAGVGNPKPEHFTAAPHTGDINAASGRERSPSHPP